MWLHDQFTFGLFLFDLPKLYRKHMYILYYTILYTIMQLSLPHNTEIYFFFLSWLEFGEHLHIAQAEVTRSL